MSLNSVFEGATNTHTIQKTQKQAETKKLQKM